MKRLFLFSVLALTLSSLISGAFAQDMKKFEMKKSDTGIEVSGTAMMTATVQALNVNERLVVLSDSAGVVQIVEAGPEVKNFDQIDIGDQVKVEFYESIALHLGEPDEEPGGGEAMVMMTAPKGDKPGMVAVDVVEVIATVEAIDKVNKKVKLKRPDGQIVTVTVDPSIGDLENIKVGDKIRARYTEALAISVTEP